MGFVIDSSILIEFERGRLDLSGYIKRWGEDAFFVSVISMSELLHGVHRANNEHIRIRRSAFVEGVFERFPLLPITPDIARFQAQVWASLQAEGRMIGLHDSWLAATCLVYGFAIVTHNVREFERVSGLNMEVW